MCPTQGDPVRRNFAFVAAEMRGQTNNTRAMAIQKHVEKELLRGRTKARNQGGKDKWWFGGKWVALISLDELGGTFSDRRGCGLMHVPICTIRLQELRRSALTGFWS